MWYRNIFILTLIKSYQTKLYLKTKHVLLGKTSNLIASKPYQVEFFYPCQSSLIGEALYEYQLGFIRQSYILILTRFN